MREREEPCGWLGGDAVATRGNLEIDVRLKDVRGEAGRWRQGTQCLSLCTRFCAGHLSCIHTGDPPGTLGVCIITPFTGKEALIKVLIVSSHSAFQQ